MIDYNTILSSFNDRGTLLKWLKRVEEALEGAGLDNVTVTVIDSTHIALNFDFADGSTVVSDPIELPEGPQGPEGPPGADATPVLANVPVGSLAPVLNALSVSGIAYKVFDGSSEDLLSDSADVAAVLQNVGDGTVTWGYVEGADVKSTNEGQGKVLMADGYDAASWQDIPISTGYQDCNLINSSYTAVGTAKCRWIKYKGLAVVTVDILSSTTAFYGIELPEDLQGFISSGKQRGQFMGSTTGTAKYYVCETDITASDPDKYLRFLDSGMVSAYTMPAYTMGVVNITLAYAVV